MRKFLLILSVLILCSCESLEECTMRSGSMTSKQVEVGSFNKILVNRGISLVVSEAPEYSVTIVSGNNLIEHIEAKINGETLVLSDHAECNWRRDYGVTTVYVTAPSLSQIQSLSEQKISSGNVLHYPTLHLISLDNGTSDFHFEVDNDVVFIETNNVSGFYLKGHTNQLSAGFYEGNGPLRAEELEAENVDVFHRSSNHMYVKPVQQLTGNLYSTGNLYCIGQPPVVDVVRHYTGKLIYW